MLDFPKAGSSRFFGGLIHSPQQEFEKVSFQLAGSKLVWMRNRFKDFRPIELKSQSLIGGKPGHRHPLSRHCDTILAARVADITSRHTRHFGNLPRNRVTRTEAFQDPDKGMAPLSSGGIEGNLLNLEVLGLHPIPNHRDDLERFIAAATGAKERR